jgi:hypothetical protein
MPPEVPNGSQFLATTIANLHMELAAAFDRIKAEQASNAELTAKIGHLEAVLAQKAGDDGA